jgi:hypothetical protein
MQSTVKGFSGPGGTAAVQDGTRPFAAVALVMLSIVSVSYSLAQALVNPALDYRWEILLGGAIGGLGFGIALSALSAHVVGAVPRAHTAAAGMNANIRTIGGAIGAAIVATVLGSHAAPPVCRVSTAGSWPS